MMNEKIRELYTSNSQAFSILDRLRDPYDAVRNGDSYSSIEVDLQRFAELIVRECMNATRGSITGLDAFNNIKNHFGIEQ